VAPLNLSLACGPYDRVRPLADGSVRIEGVDLNFLPIWPPHEIFWRMLRNAEFDSSELSLCNYMMCLDQGDDRFVGIPVFPSRIFRHSYVWVNVDAGIDQPKDLVGKRIGCPEYAMTALLYVRGLLKHDYGVLPEQLTWVRAIPERVQLTLADDIHVEEVAAGKNIEDMLEQGEIDAYASPSPPAGFLSGSPRIRRLFPDPASLEADYYRRTGIFPIMHLIAIRRDVYERNRWLARSLTKAFQNAKDHAYEQMAGHLSSMVSLPWATLDLERARQVFNGDPYPYGVKENRASLEAAALFSYEQGLTKRLLAIEDLFVPECLR
jgi:4,5-dihydroxyphthalate decarboxylase